MKRQTSKKSGLQQKGVDTSAISGNQQKSVHKNIMPPSIPSNLAGDEDMMKP